jgi:hypothetical protein
MMLLTIISLAALLVIAGITAASLFSGLGLMLFLCIAAIVCVIGGVWLLISLLGKGIFSLLKCVGYLVLMLIPAVNIIALIILAVIAYKSLRNE